MQEFRSYACALFICLTLSFFSFRKIRKSLYAIGNIDEINLIISRDIRGVEHLFAFRGSSHKRRYKRIFHPPRSELYDLSIRRELCILPKDRRFLNLFSKDTVKRSTRTAN